MAISKIRLETKGSHRPSDWTVYLNDVDISHYLRGIKIDVEVGHPTRATLQLAATAIEMPDVLWLDILDEPERECE